MASVQQVYNTLKDLANKDQRGFVTPTVFNNFAPVAQAKIFNDLFKELNLAKNLKVRGLDLKRHLGKMKQIEEDLSIFSKTSTISQSDGVFSRPDDLAKIISIRTSGTYVFGTSTSTSIDVMYDEEKLEYILQSDLSKPSTSAPVALLSNVIEVFPTSVKKIKIRYYKQPEGLNASTGARTASMPKFGYDQSLPGGKEVYLAANSVDFELPDHYVPTLVMEIGKMIGINLRDEAVLAYSAQQPQQ